jgi:alpha-glucosidase (family GH31 glycosyl hydrolase)
MFGKDMLVSPITAPMDNSTGLSQQKIWLPKGNDWFEWYFYYYR